jgi:SAM-dependent methyltransferase
MKNLAKRLVPNSIKPVLRRAYDSALASRYRRQVNAALESANAPLSFSGLEDEAWFWANTEGYREDARLRELLPAMPDDFTQLRFTGVAGDRTLREGFEAYRLFKEIFQQHGGDLARARVLDYGCGWGRIIRFFLKDVLPEQLWGIDCFDEVLQVSKDTNPWCHFELVNAFPPSTLADDSFDFIYSYSVFSHLSEDAHLAWLREFKRILKPGGLLIATTRKREFIELCRRLNQGGDVAIHKRGVAESFPQTERALQDYDEGKYCYHPAGGGGPLDSSFFGETCIPKAYVLQHWTNQFEFLDFIDDERCLQSVIVVKKS